MVICGGFLCGISCSLSCSLGCVGTLRAKTTGFELLSELMNSCSVWHRAHVALGIGSICCTGRIFCGFVVELSGLNLGSGILKTVDVKSRLGSVCAE